MAYEFDADKEPATVQIEVNPARYVKINDKLYYAEKVEEDVRLQDGTIEKRITWNKERSQAWVPPRIADQLTRQNVNEAYAQVPPTAREIGRRTVEDAGAKAGAAVPATKRKPVE